MDDCEGETDNFYGLEFQFGETIKMNKASKAQLNVFLGGEERKKNELQLVLDYIDLFFGDLQVFP